jgi:hypothetical protein
LTLLACPAAAQSTTEDGIRAALQGNYQAAGRILRPLADDPARPDPVAQFFLAILYNSGLGVQGDMGRACALFLRSSAASHPFSEQAAGIAAHMRELLGDGASMMCVAEERWRGGPPQSFSLGPDHRIVFADTSVRVFDGDREQYLLIRLPPGPGFLPIEYVPLDVTSPRALRRHFFHWFQWLPDKLANPSSWTLAWMLSEVVHDQYGIVASERNLAEVKGDTPPSSYDLTKVVRLQVNASGRAEVTIGGMVPRTEVIPLQAGADVPQTPLASGHSRDANAAAPGQTAVVEGVAALARGDYQRAVALLEPVANDRSSQNLAAQFFMAGLYETGRGVPMDDLRACALYARAVGDFEKPFGQPAEGLLRRFLARGREFDHECQTLANVGFDSAFEGATFNLGPGHSVEWTLAAATVTYEGRVKHHDMPFFMLPGARFRPLRYTELATGPTRTLARHFTEVFAWQPEPNSESWKLRWQIFEVVADDIIRIDTPEAVITVAGAAPPSWDAFDVRQYAVLRVDDQGNAEWAVLKGDRPETQRIESEAERREVREAALMRDAALKKVDWKRREDLNRPPSAMYADADGCGWLQVYGWSADRSEAIVVLASGPQPEVQVQPGTFDLERDRASVSVSVNVYGGPQSQFDFCSDVRMPRLDGAGPQTWQAVAGTMTIALSPPGVRARSPHLRRATITLTNLVLRNAAGRTVRMTGPLKLSALVGSVSG